LLVGGALGQIGEFSFIVAGMGVALGLANNDLQAVIVAAAIVAITVNSPVMSAIVGLVERMTRRAADEAPWHAVAPAAFPAGTGGGGSGRPARGRRVPRVGPLVEICVNDLRLFGSVAARSHRGALLTVVMELCAAQGPGASSRGAGSPCVQARRVRIAWSPAAGSGRAVGTADQAATKES